MRLIVLFLAILFMPSCSKDRSVVGYSGLSLPVETVADAEKTLVFLLDGKEGLFKKVKWYYYSMENHKIWSLFDVFVIQNKERDLFKLQILSYYDLSNTSKSGIYTLRVQPQGGAQRQVTIDASACGNAYTNPKYDDCIRDPAQNTYTYLNLKSLDSWRMTDQEALRNTKWDLGFKGTDIIVSSGDDQISRTAGGLLHREREIFLTDSSVDVKKLQEKIKNNFSQGSFSSTPIPSIVSLYVPSESGRVVDEDQWYKYDVGALRLIEDRWWAVLSANGEHAFKFSVQSIESSGIDDHLLHLSFSRLGSKEFDEEPNSVGSAEFQLKADKDGAVVFCLDFDDRVQVDCQKESEVWEVRFEYRPDVAEKKWLIFTNSGAMGPMSYDEISKVLVKN